MTREQRFEVYQEMLRCLNMRIEFEGFCDLLRFTTESDQEVSSDLINYPELMEYRPEGHEGLFWFTPCDWKYRRHILETILKNK